MKKQFKKILVDGLGIQTPKGESEKECVKWTKQFSRALKKYNVIENNEWLVKVGKNEYQIKNYGEVIGWLASKNLLMVYLNKQNRIEIVNDYEESVEIIKSLTKEEVEFIYNTCEDFFFTKEELEKLNILDGE